MKSLFTRFRKSDTSSYSVGQLWAYKTRPGEENSTVLINKIESDPKFGEIYHISVLDTKVKSPNVSGGIQSELPHFPVSKATLEQSLTRIIRHSQINPEYVTGYNQWKEAFDQGNAGIFTISVAEIIDVIERVVASQ